MILVKMLKIFEPYSLVGKESFDNAYLQGEPVHLEATFMPARDPDLKVSWMNEKDQRSTPILRLDNSKKKLLEYAVSYDNAVSYDTRYPINSPFQVEWQKNGAPIGASQLVKTRHELGWATLDILSVNPDHNGEWWP